MARERNEARETNTQDRLEKLRNKLMDEADDLDMLDAERLRERIIECQANLVENRREMEADRDYARARDKLAALRAPYTEATKRLTSVAEYCTLRLEQLGK